MPSHCGTEKEAHPDVSVVMGAYNCERSVARALDSVLAQSFTSFEIIVVDDASTDATADVVGRFAERDRRITLLRNDVNRGPSAARTRAIAAARGRWIALLDSDDWYDADRLGTLVTWADRTGADLLIDNLLVHDEATGGTKTAYPPWPSSPFGPVPAKDVCAQDWPCTGTMGLGYAKPLIRRDFLLRTGLRYAADIRVGEDFDLYMRCIMQGARLFLIDEPHYHYVRRKGSLSKTHDRANFRDFAVVNRRLMEEAQRQGDHALVKALCRRQEHLDSHLSFMELREALLRRQFGQSLKKFWVVPSRRYAAFRLTCASYQRVKSWTRGVGCRLYSYGAPRG
ncbi:glycosyltransferase family 2 protein [Azospirillum sp. sgz302134]